MKPFAPHVFQGVAVHLDTILFLLFIGMAGLLRLLAKKTSGLTGNDETPAARRITPTTPVRSSGESDEQRIRRFLEALGQPPTSVPPPPVKARATPPPLTQFQRKQIEETARAARRRNPLRPMPPVTTVPPDLPRRVTMPRTTTETPYDPTDIIPMQAAAEPTAPAAPGSPEPYSTVRPSSTARLPAPLGLSLLGSRDDLRRAIILREVFGPPRGLQPLEMIGTA